MAEKPKEPCRTSHSGSSYTHTTSQMGRSGQSSSERIREQSAARDRRANNRQHVHGTTNNSRPPTGRETGTTGRPESSGSTRQTGLSTQPSSGSTRQTVLSIQPSSGSTRQTVLSIQPSSGSTRQTGLSTQPSSGSTRQTSSSIQPSSSSTRQTGLSTQPSSGSTRQTVLSIQPSSGSTRQTGLSTQPSSGSTRQTVLSIQPSSGSTRQTGLSTQPSSGSTRQTVLSIQPSSGSTRQTGLSTQPSSGSTRQTVLSIQPSSSSTRQTGSSTQPSRTANKDLRAAYGLSTTSNTGQTSLTGPVYTSQTGQASLNTTITISSTANRPRTLPQSVGVAQEEGVAHVCTPTPDAAPQARHNRVLLKSNTSGVTVSDEVVALKKSPLLLPNTAVQMTKTPSSDSTHLTPHTHPSLLSQRSQESPPTSPFNSGPLTSGGPLSNQFLTQEEFREIRTKQLSAQLAPRRGVKRQLADLLERQEERREGGGELLPEAAINTLDHIKMKSDKKSKMESIMSGREGRDKFGSRKLNPHSSTTKFLTISDAPSKMLASGHRSLTVNPQTGKSPDASYDKILHLRSQMSTSSGTSESSDKVVGLEDSFPIHLMTGEQKPTSSIVSGLQAQIERLQQQVEEKDEEIIMLRNIEKSDEDETIVSMSEFSSGLVSKIDVEDVEVGGAKMVGIRTSMQTDENGKPMAKAGRRLSRQEQDLVSRVAVLESQLSIKQTEIDTLFDQNARKETTITTLTKTLETSKTTAKRGIRGTDADKYTDHVTAMTSQMSELEEKDREQRKTIAKLEGQVEKARTVSQKAKNLFDDKKQLVTQVQELEESLKEEKTRRMSEASVSLDGASREERIDTRLMCEEARKVPELQAEIKQLQDKVKDAEEIARDTEQNLIKQVGEVSNFEEKIGKLRLELEKANEENINLSSQLQKSSTSDPSNCSEAYQILLRESTAKDQELTNLKSLVADHDRQSELASKTAELEMRTSVKKQGGQRKVSATKFDELFKETPINGPNRASPTPINKKKKTLKSVTHKLAKSFGIGKKVKPELVEVQDTPLSPLTDQQALEDSPSLSIQHKGGPERRGSDPPLSPNRMPILELYETPNDGGGAEQTTIQSDKTGRQHNPSSSSADPLASPLPLGQSDDQPISGKQGDQKKQEEKLQRPAQYSRDTYKTTLSNEQMKLDELRATHHKVLAAKESRLQEALDQKDKELQSAEDELKMKDEEFQKQLKLKEDFYQAAIKSMVGKELLRLQTVMKNEQTEEEARKQHDLFAAEMAQGKDDSTVTVLDYTAGPPVGGEREGRHESDEEDEFLPALESLTEQKEMQEENDNRTVAEKLRDELEEMIKRAQQDGETHQQEIQGLCNELSSVSKQLQELKSNNDELKEVIRVAVTDAPPSDTGVQQGEEAHAIKMWKQMRTKYLKQVSKTIEAQDLYKHELERNKDKEDKIEALSVQVSSFRKIASQHQQLESHVKLQSTSVIQLKRELEATKAESKELKGAQFQAPQYGKRYRERAAEKRENEIKFHLRLQEHNNELQRVQQIANEEREEKRSVIKKLEVSVSEVQLIQRQSEQAERDFQAALQTLRQALKDKEEKVDSLSVQVSSFRKIASQHQQLESHVKLQSTSVMQLKRELEATKDELEASRKSSLKVSESNEELSKLQREKYEIEDERDILKQEMDAERDNVKSLKKQLAESQVTVATLESSLRASSKSVGVDDKDQEIQLLKTEYQLFQRQSEQAERDFEGALKTKVEEMKRTSAEKTQLMSQMEHFRSLSQRYEKQLQDAEVLYQQRQAELKHELKELSYAQQEVTRLTSVLDRQQFEFQHIVKRKDDSLGELEAQGKRLKDTVTSLEVTINGLKVKLNQAERMKSLLDQQWKAKAKLLPHQTQQYDSKTLDCFRVRPRHELTFDHQIGEGSFGSVYAIDLDGTPCIAKRLHDILMGRGRQEAVSQGEKESVHDRFFRECVLLSRTKHPNIVKFIGVHFGKDNCKYDLTLFMERLSTDLHHFLTTNPDISFSTKVSILQNVSSGLLCLHQNFSIIHRDLSARNILLTEDNQAKIADLGVSKIIDLNTEELTQAPGAHPYMSPEALLEAGDYDKSLDIFSFGVIALFAAIQEFPKYSHAHIPDAIMAKGEGEIYRRREWIDKMDARQPELSSLVLCCLCDDPVSRPSAVCLNILLTEMSREYK